MLGLDVAERPMEIRARLGYMPETDGHIPGMNAVSFVAYCGQLAGLPAVDAMQRAHEVLYYVGLGEARYRNLETYSTGMKQRIKLAQAIVHDPDLLFLDEPTNGMDPEGPRRDARAHSRSRPQQERQPDPLVAPPARRRVHLRSRRRDGQGAGRRAGADRRVEGPGRPRLRAARQGRRREPPGVHRRPAEGGHGVPLDRRRRDARVRAHRRRRLGAHATSRFIFALAAGRACRSGTCVRACRRSRTCSPKRSGRNDDHAYPRSELPPLRGRRRLRRAAPGWSSPRPGS